jgi:predicted methyltransferase
MGPIWYYPWRFWAQYILGRGNLALQALRFDETRVLGQLLNTTDPWQLAGMVRLDFPRYVRTLKRLRRKGLIETSPRRVRLTPAGMRMARHLGLRSRGQISEQVKSAKKRFDRITRKRPSSISLYDQGYMTVDSVFRRAQIMADLGDADSKRIVILGDDDLLSIAICLCARPERVVVFEIDGRVVGFIRETAARLRLPIVAECADLRVPLPRRFRGGFDTFVADPSETIKGLKMFIGRGLYLLSRGEGRAGYFGLTSVEASSKKWRRIERWILNNYPVAITHAVPGSAYYHNWSDLVAQTACFSLDCLEHPPGSEWFNSALVRLETLPGFRPKVMGRIRGLVFMDDEAVGEIQEEVR